MLRLIFPIFSEEKYWSTDSLSINIDWTSTFNISQTKKNLMTKYFGISK